MKQLNQFKQKKAIEKYEVLTEKSYLQKVPFFLHQRIKDIKENSKSKKFNDYGLTVYCGRQGSGKSISMVERLEQIRRDYPTVTIMTNFGYKHETAPLDDWEQIIKIRNKDGIVFCIDEIQNEFDVYQSRNFNLEILKVITQQRKQGIKVLATSQIFTRVSKPLREQCFEVVECFTVAGRWTFQRCFDADDYNLFIDNPNPEKKFDVPRKWRKNFVQTNEIRSKYDSYAVIKSMKKLLNKKDKFA